MSFLSMVAQKMNIKLQKLSTYDFHEIIQLSDTVFGKRYITYTQLEAFYKHDQHFGIAAFHETQMVGFVLNYGNHPEVSHLVKKANVGNENSNDFALIKTIAIHQNYQQQGIASQLIKQSLKILQKKYSSILCLAWVHPANHLSHILKKQGFTLKKTLLAYWKNESIAKNYHCILCGKPPCLCDAQLWER